MTVPSPTGQREPELPPLEPPGDDFDTFDYGSRWDKALAVTLAVAVFLLGVSVVILSLVQGARP